MTTSLDNPGFPSLFAHVTRKDWGVGILAGESNGKRRYLFEDGEERTLADGFYQMMRRVDEPDAVQQAAYTRLRSALAARNKSADKGVGSSFSEQLVRFHDTYPAGFSDAEWIAAARGEGAERRLPRHRQPLIDDAKAQLSMKALDTLISKQQFAQVWELLTALIEQTDLVPAAQLKLKAGSEDLERALAVAIRELLYGTGPYEQRFDRYLAAFVNAFGHHPRWELASVVSALVHPRDHVCIEPTTFRKQLKLSGFKKSAATQPSSAAYASFLGGARLVANKLAENGEVPRDLLDVRDFIVFTLKAQGAPRPARSSAKAARKTEE